MNALITLELHFYLNEIQKIIDEANYVSFI